MSYKDFTLEQIAQSFAVSIQSNAFPSQPPVQLSSAFAAYLAYSTPLALSINTEKARSEMIIAPILVELKRISQDRISLFSGIEFNVDPASGLNGFCDFMISLSSQQLYLEAPVAIVIEAKNENIKGGLAQCLAAMIAAQRFNQARTELYPIYGAVTTGNQWKFLKLTGSLAQIDSKDYYIDQLDAIFSILVSMTDPQPQLALR